MSKETKKFISTESLSGLCLIFSAILALYASNSRYQDYYHLFLDTPFLVQIGSFTLGKPLFLWINDGLMSIFFLIIGLELKRECLVGELKNFHTIFFPSIAAIGGMLVPTIVYFFINQAHHEYFDGWAIPMATDIAFSLGILSLFGKRVPTALKLFLLTLAVIDDLGAIIVIALFHTKNLSWLSLLLGSVCVVGLLLLNYSRVSKLTPYLFLGVVLWLAVLKSGFHATLAGIILALIIPLFRKDGKPLLETLENDLHGFVAFLVLPLFAFANAGVQLQGLTLTAIVHPISLGIILGLVIGKQIGIFGFTLLYRCIMKKAKLMLNYWELYAVACLCGIGFTMSLFLASLAFGNDATLLNFSRLGILIGSLISTILGVVVLHFVLPRKHQKR